MRGLFSHISRVLPSVCFLVVFVFEGEKRGLSSEQLRDDRPQTVVFKDWTKAKAPSRTASALDGVPIRDWPSQETIQSLRPPAEDVPKEAVEETVHWLRSIMRDEWLPPDLGRRLIPLRGWTQNDWFIVRFYRINGPERNSLQIIENNHCTWVTVLPPPDHSGSSPSWKRAKKCADLLLRFPPASNLGVAGGTHPETIETSGVLVSTDIDATFHIGAEWFKWLPWCMDQEAITFMLHRRWLPSNVHGLPYVGPNIVDKPMRTKFFPPEEARVQRRPFKKWLPIAMIVVVGGILVRFAVRTWKFATRTR